MADVAHDLSGLASSKSSDIPRKASRPDSDKGKLRVFISYSRDDLKFADQLDAALRSCGFECLIDHGISGGEDWKRRLGNLISDADTVVFVLSPSSARSEICGWEVEEAARLNKRILPVICRPLEGVSPPPRLRELNYIFFYEEPKVSDSGFGTGLANLVTALNTDFDWLREHTRYLQRAMEWDAGGRQADRLLSGNDILEAKGWAAHRPKSAPEPTALHLDFIRASEEEAEARLSEQRKQLEMVAAAQAERGKALHQAEEAQRKRATMAMVRNIAFVIVSVLAVFAGWLYWNAAQQRKVAEEQRAVAETETKLAEAQKEQADDILGRATNIIAKLQTRMDDETMKDAFALVRAGAEHGDANSIKNLGWLYANGRGVTQDYRKAREWFEKAAAKNNATAMFYLGWLYANGYGVALDYGKAGEWYEKAAARLEKAAAKGDAKAMGALGWSYAAGYGVAQDYAKAREWYEKAAAKGETDAMTQLGWFYAAGRGVAQDYAKAREWYEKAVAKDYAIAMTQLGVFYANGRGVTQDYAKAREWWEKAAAKGETDAMNDLGALYDAGRGVVQDYGRAREWYEKAAANDNVTAMTNLGFLYAHGRGVAQDYAKAREWFEKAAVFSTPTRDVPNADAMTSLGLLYANGYGVAQDYGKAREWFEKAAAKGDVTAMTNLASLYANGHGVAQDYAKAREWYEKAAAKDDATAMTQIGVFYVNGYGVAQGYGKAREWFEKAAAKGETDAMNNLGALYANGRGAAQDFAKAREWYEKAAAKGDTEAKMAVEQLPIREAEMAGRYDEALRLEEAFATKLEAEETKRGDKLDEQVATELNRVVWYALFAKEFAKALTVADHAHTLFPDNLVIETNRAHALMFLGRGDEAKALYLAHKGKRVSEQDSELWERAINKDFADFRKAGLTSPMMVEIEKELGISP